MKKTMFALFLVSLYLFFSNTLYGQGVIPDFEYDKDQVFVIDTVYILEERVGPNTYEKIGEEWVGTFQRWRDCGIITEFKTTMYSLEKDSKWEDGVYTSWEDSIYNSLQYKKLVIKNGDKLYVITKADLGEFNIQYRQISFASPNSSPFSQAVERNGIWDTIQNGTIRVSQIGGNMIEERIMTTDEKIIFSQPNIDQWNRSREPWFNKKYCDLLSIKFLYKKTH